MIKATYLNAHGPEILQRINAAATPEEQLRILEEVVQNSMQHDVQEMPDALPQTSLQEDRATVETLLRQLINDTQQNSEVRRRHGDDGGGRYRQISYSARAYLGEIGTIEQILTPHFRAQIVHWATVAWGQNAHVAFDQRTYNLLISAHRDIDL